MGRAESENRRQFFFKHRLASGEVRQVEVFSGPIVIQARKLLYSIVHDITARKQAEAALAAERDKLLNLLEAMEDGVYIADRDYTIEYANPVILREFGPVEGRKCYEYFHDRREVCPWCKNPEVFAGETIRWEWHSSKNQKTYDLIDTPIRNADGSISKLEIFRDITERKRAEKALQKAHGELERRVEERTAELRQAYEQLVWEMEERQQVEEKLRESEARFAAFMEHLPGLAVMRDLKGRYVFANESWQKLVGREPQEWLGKTLEEVWPPEIAQRFKDLDRQVLAFREPLEVVETLELADGIHYFLTHRFLIYDQEGSPSLVGAVAVDITARQRAEEALREQACVLDAFFRHSLTPLVFLDRDFNFLRVNEAYARACRREVSEFIGRNHFEVYPSEAQAIFEEVVRTKTPYQVAARPFVYPDQPERGVTYWDWTVAPILDEAGEVDFLVFSLNEVTERVRAEEARNRLIEILEATPDFVATADQNGRMVYLNQASRDLLGLGPEEDLTWLKARDIPPPWAVDLIRREGLPAAFQKGFWRGETALINREREEVPVSQVLLAHKDPAGRVRFFSTIARDISDLKRAEADLQSQSAILEGMNRIFREALTCETEAELGRTCLAVAEELSGSQFGVMDKLNERGKLDALAFSDPGWDACRIAPGRDLKFLHNIEPQGLTGKVVHTGQSLIANDPASHPDAMGLPAGHPPLHAFLGAPLKQGDRVIGLIGLGNKPGGYDDRDRETLEILAVAIVEAWMRKRVELALKESEENLHILAAQLMDAQESERGRLSRELHDELGQSLLLLKFKIAYIHSALSQAQAEVREECRLAGEYLNGLIDSVRRLSRDLSPAPLEELGLTSALKYLVTEFCRHYKIRQFSIKMEDIDQLFDPPVQVNIYRIFQEALTNIGKHARASRIAAQIKKENGQIEFMVWDNGQGFAVAEALARRGGEKGIGLAAMQERLRMIGGALQIWSRKGAGAKITFSVPFKRE
jgi:PAS domain S-box-containing protein